MSEAQLLSLFWLPLMFALAYATYQIFKSAWTQRKRGE